MLLTLSSCLLFIWLIQSVNRAQIFDITFLLLIFAPAPTVVATDIVPLSIYASL